jgi:hypothetical protein
MKLDDELTMELAKNKADEFVIRKELDLAKQQLIDELDDGLGEEIRREILAEMNKPIKYKKPFRLKIKEFFDRISKVLGN